MKHTSHSSANRFARPAAVITVICTAIAALHVRAASESSEPSHLIQPSPTTGVIALRGHMQKPEQMASERAVPSAATFDPCPGEWTTPFNDADLAGETIYALAPYEGELYAGGTFTTIGGDAVNHIARWDGESWSAIDDGVNGLVRTMLVHDGSLYVGGHFTAAGGIAADRIARWDGESWHALGEGFNNAVMALAVHENQIIAGGLFTHAGATEVNRVARWDASEDGWQPLGDGMNRSVLALASTDIGLIAGGHFTAADGETAGRVALWSDGQWMQLGDDFTMGAIHALWKDKSGLPIAAGSTVVSGFPGNSDRIGRWTGESGFWIGFTGAMPPTPNHAINVLHHYGNMLHAAGKFTDVSPTWEDIPTPAQLTARWDGANWQPLGDGLGGMFNGSAEAMTVYNGMLIVGGYFATAGGQPATSIAAWDAPPSAGPADLNCDGVVDVDDLFRLLAKWGECDDPDACLGDLDGNGVVDVDDLFILLAQWS